MVVQVKEYVQIVQTLQALGLVYPKVTNLNEHPYIEKKEEFKRRQRYDYARFNSCIHAGSELVRDDLLIKVKRASINS